MFLQFKFYAIPIIEFLCIYVWGIAKMFWPEINGYIGGYISYGQWPDRRGSACAYAPKCASAHQKN